MEKEINVGSCMENPKAKSGDTVDTKYNIIVLMWLVPRMGIRTL